MGSIDTACQKERFVVLFPELFADPFRDEPIAAELLVRRIERSPVGFDILPRATARQTDRPLFRIQSTRKRIFRLFCRVIFIPRLCIDEVVQDLPGPASPVAVIGEELRQQLGIR